MQKFGPSGRVVIELIDHKQQRYETAGDWFRLSGDEQILSETFVDPCCTLLVRASKLKGDPNNFFALAVAYHELGEALACIANDIDEHAVDEFDTHYKSDGEPGDDPRAPYTKQHGLATACERILIGAMGLSWGLYEKAIDSLPKWKKKK
jgi:hypothetical protein